MLRGGEYFFRWSYFITRVAATLAKHVGCLIIVGVEGLLHLAAIPV
jgi:hypothetical protein